MKYRNRINGWLLGCLALCSVMGANAAVYSVPGNSDTIVGQLQYVHARKSDTLVDIARRFDGARIIVCR